MRLRISERSWDLSYLCEADSIRKHDIWVICVGLIVWKSMRLVLFVWDWEYQNEHETWVICVRLNVLIYETWGTLCRVDTTTWPNGQPTHSHDITKTASINIHKKTLHQLHKTHHSFEIYRQSLFFMLSLVLNHPPKTRTGQVL